jgi:hypothetical protein
VNKSFQGFFAGPGESRIAAGPAPKDDEAGLPRLLTPAEMVRVLKTSTSWLAKARMRGDGPPFIKIGRSVRYPEPGAREWLRAQSRISTSQIKAAELQISRHARKKIVRP